MYSRNGLRYFPVHFFDFPEYAEKRKGLQDLLIKNNIKIIEFPADWEKFGKKAGYIRNEEMAKYSDSCIVFWDGKSKGTKHMIELAKKYNLNLKIVKY